VVGEPVGRGPQRRGKSDETVQNYIRDILTVSIESSPKQTNKRNRPTVNKNGHREMGVCNLGSSTEINDCCKEDNPMCQPLFARMGELLLQDVTVNRATSCIKGRCCESEGVVHERCECVRVCMCV